MRVAGIVLLSVFLFSVNIASTVMTTCVDNIRVGSDGNLVRRTFLQSDVAQVLHPFFMSRKEYLKRYEYNWRTRLMMEYQTKRCYFLTLTYTDDNLPKGTPQQQLDQVTRDLQLFWKRMRQRVDYHNLGLNFKYFAVTENGEEYGRLHCHALVFADGSNVRVLNSRTATPLFKLIDTAWQQGRTQIRVADKSKIKYVTKYIFKRCHDMLYHSWKSNGIGRSYLTDALTSYLRTHLQGYIHLGGKVRYLPRYIRTIVFDDDMRAQLTEDYILSRPPKDERFTKGYYMQSYVDISPLPNYIGDRIIKMQDDNRELAHVLKYGGQL